MVKVEPTAPATAAQDVAARPTERGAASRGRAGRRILAGAVLCGATTLLSVAAWLEPSMSGVGIDGGGMGTHTQLGIAPCGWPSALGVPCPTCGMTTAFALAADGRLLSALLCQPAGAVLALATAIAGVLSLHVLVSGGGVGLVLGRLAGPRGIRVWWLLGGLILGAWAWKIACWRGWL